MLSQCPKINILTAEDDPDDCLLVKEAITESKLECNLFFVEDGIKLMQFLRRQNSDSSSTISPRPDLIFLDLNMPNKDGRESLAEIKAEPQLRGIPIVIFTNSQSEDDVQKTYDLGSAGYINKPSSFTGMQEIIKVVEQYWFEIVQLTNKGDYNLDNNKNVLNSSC